MSKTFEIAWELMKSDEKGDNAPTNPGLWSQAKSKADPNSKYIRQRMQTLGLLNGINPKVAVGRRRARKARSDYHG